MDQKDEKRTIVGHHVHIYELAGVNIRHSEANVAAASASEHILHHQQRRCLSHAWTVFQRGELPEIDLSGYDDY